MRQTKRIIYLALLLALALLMTGSCSRKTYPPANEATGLTKAITTHQVAAKKDTTTKTSTFIQSDSVKETTELTQAEVQLPQVDIERQTVLEAKPGEPAATTGKIKDTTSTITDGRYISIARITNGKLTHTLQTLPGASIQTQVPRTTKTEVSTRERSNTKEGYHSDSAYTKTDTKSQVPMPVEKKLTSWQKFKQKVGGWALVVVAVCIVLTIARWLARRQRNR